LYPFPIMPSTCNWEVCKCVCNLYLFIRFFYFG